MRIKSVESKTIISKSNLPDADYVVNPYVGCSFGCLYCYASFMGRSVHEPVSEWGNYVVIKENAHDLFKKELVKIMSKFPLCKIMMSSVTDPYNHLEAKCKLTKRILQNFGEAQFQGSLSLLTKSPLIIRDLKELQKIPNVEVGMTITAPDDSFSKALELKAPAVSLRLSALKKLSKEGIPTYAFIGPLLPHLYLDKEQLEKLFYNVKEAGVKSIFVEQLNMKPYISDRLQTFIDDLPKPHRDCYNKENLASSRSRLHSLTNQIVNDLDIPLRLGEIIQHNEAPKGTPHR